MLALEKLWCFRCHLRTEHIARRTSSQIRCMRCGCFFRKIDEKFRPVRRLKMAVSS